MQKIQHRFKACEVKYPVPQYLFFSQEGIGQYCTPKGDNTLRRKMRDVIKNKDRVKTMAKGQSEGHLNFSK
jgi:hypothetical protein